LVLVLGAVGLGLLTYVISELGPARIAAELKGLGSILPVVLLVTGVKYPLQAAGWRLALRREARPPWGESISATITGDALGYLTWAGPFTGEPIRAILIRASVPVPAGIAAGAAERAVYNLTAAGLVWAAMLVLLSSAHASALVSAAGASVLAAAGVIALARRRRRERPRADMQPTRVPSGNPMGGTWPVRVAAFLEEIRDLWLTRRGVLPAIAILGLLQHALLVFEAYLMLSALGAAPTLRTALVFEAATKIVNTVGMIVPGRLGVSEGGSALLAGALGFAANHGLSLALMRRVRALIWAAVGLALLPLQEARARRPR
jgi:Lysylphosphatidylglycerol synthase TM region